MNAFRKDSFHLMGKSTFKVLQPNGDQPDARSCEAAAPRTPLEVRNMAQVVQLNLIRLRREAEGRTPGAGLAGLPRLHEPALPLRFREALIEAAAARAYSDPALILRLHEVWGQFCLFMWYFHLATNESSAGVDALSPLPETRCGASRAAKHDEIHAVLWKLRFEQRRRADAPYRASAECRRHALLASRIPVPLFERHVEDCSDDELLVGACEYAGMLAAIRWINDASRAWGEAGIMNVGEGPFPPADENGEHCGDPSEP